MNGKKPSAIASLAAVALLLVLAATVTPAEQAYAQYLAFDKTVQTAKNSTIVISLDGSAPDGREFHFITHDIPDHGDLELGPGNTAVYTPNDGFVGTDSFTVAVWDDNAPWGGDNVGLITIQVVEPYQGGGNDSNPSGGSDDEGDNDSPVTINYSKHGKAVWERWYKPIYEAVLPYSALADEPLEIGTSDELLPHIVYDPQEAMKVIHYRQLLEMRPSLGLADLTPEQEAWLFHNVVEPAQETAYYWLD